MFKINKCAHFQYKICLYNGKCGGKRTNTHGARLFIDSDTTHSFDVRIIGAWANGYNEGVRFTAPFIFHYTDSPISATEGWNRNHGTNFIGELK